MPLAHMRIAHIWAGDQHCPVGAALLEGGCDVCGSRDGCGCYRWDLVESLGQMLEVVAEITQAGPGIPGRIGHSAEGEYASPADDGFSIVGGRLARVWRVRPCSRPVGVP